MKKKLLASLLIVVAFVCVLAFGVSAATVTISTAEEFAAIANDLDGDYILGDDIEISARLATTDSAPFTGTFDGKGHTITLNGLSGQYASAFGYVGGEAYIHDLTVAGTITGNNGYKGGIAGKVIGTATIENCTSEVVITGTQYVGGIVGYVDINDPSSVVVIKNCKNTGTVSGTASFIGGIVGRFEIHTANTQSTHEITGCTNTATVMSTDATGTLAYYGLVGGIVGILTTGENAKVSVSNCFNSGDVSIAYTGTEENKGTYAGGIVGFCRAYATNANTVSNCMNTGDIYSAKTGTEYGARVGGIVGRIVQNAQTVTNCYNTGSVKAANNKTVGPVIGYDSTTAYVNCSNLYYLPVSGDTYDCTAKSIAVNESNYGTKATFSGFSEVYWAFENTGALLKTQLVLNTTINSAAELKMLMASSNATVLGKSYTLACDINLEDDGDEKPYGVTPLATAAPYHSPIGHTDVSHSFTGTFDGKTHTISGLEIVGTQHATSLFGRTIGATIQNLTVSGTVKSDYDYTGGIVGLVRSSEIKNCISNVTVTSTGNRAGGIVGYIYDDTYADGKSSSVTGCTNNKAVTGTTCVGGIVGDIYTYTATRTGLKFTISDCVNNGTVKTTSGDSAGGILGRALLKTTTTNTSELVVTNCTNTGTVTSANEKAGGIVGFILDSADTYNATITLTGLVNKGKVTNASDQRGSIVGYMCSPLDADGDGVLPVTISDCRDEGDNASTAYMMFYCVQGTNKATINISKCYNKNGKAIVYDFTQSVDDVVVSYYPNVTITLEDCVIAKHITHPNEILVIMNESSLWGWDFALKNSVDLSKATNTATYSQKPIGNKTTPFTGSFNGNKYTISGIGISGTAHGTGFFGVVRGATIKNLTAQGTVTSTVGICGGVIGVAFAPLTVDTVVNNIKVDAYSGGNGNYVGGVIGIVYFDQNNVDATINNVENKADITGYAYVGGVVGEITSERVVSGLFEMKNVYNHNITLTNAVNHGTVTANGENVAGGVLGYFRYRGQTGTNTFTMNKCANYGTVKGSGTSSDFVGGVVSAILENTITNATHTPKVTLKISELHNSGNVSSTKNTYTGSVIAVLRVPGTLGSLGSISDIYNDNASVAEYGIIGEASCAENYSSSSFTLTRAYNYAGDKVVRTHGSGTTITEDDCFTKGQDASALLENAAWVDTTQGPMLKEYSTDILDNSIDSAIELMMLMNSPDRWDESYTVSTDIDLSKYTGSLTQKPIGNDVVAFTGSFDGQGHTISGVNINYNTYGAGFFGVVSDNKIDRGAVIKDFTLQGKVVTSERFAGAVVGMICGSVEISGIINEAQISSTYTGTNAGRIGGIVGVITLNNYLGDIRDVQNIVGINGKITVTIENCINKANIVGIADEKYVAYVQTRFGGIVGSISPTHSTEVSQGTRGASIITVKGCVNEGSITAEGLILGGIVGKLESGGNPLNEILITECENYGKITSNYKGGSSFWNGTYCGGIVGYASLTIDEPTNGAASPEPCTSMIISFNYNDGDVTAPYANEIGSKDYEVPPDDATSEDGTIDEGTGESGSTDSGSTDTGSLTVPSYFKRNAQIGGILGYAAYSTDKVSVTVKNNLNDGHIYAPGNDIGGIVGIANPAHIFDNHNRGMVESTLYSATGNTTYGKYVGGIIGRINKQNYCIFKGNYNIGELTNYHSNDSVVFGVGGGQVYYPEAYFNNYYSNVLKSTDKNSTYVGEDLHLASSFEGLNERGSWVFTTNNGPELDYFHTEYNVGDYKWVKADDGTYYYGCCNLAEHIIESNVTTPVIYVDDNNGKDTNAGNTAATAVATLKEAVERLSKSGGIVKVVGDYTLGSSIKFDDWGTNTITFTSNTAGDAIVITTNGVRLLLGGNTKFENIAFKGTSSAVKNIVIAANYHDLTMTGITASNYADAIITAGEDYPTASNTASTTSKITLYGVTNGSNPSNCFYNTVYLGSRISKDLTGIKVANKNVTLETYGETTIHTIRAMSCCGNVSGVINEQCNITVNLNDSTALYRFRTGDVNVNGTNNDTSAVTDRLTSLTLNFNGNSHTTGGTIDITNVIKSTVSVSSEKSGRTVPLEGRIKFFMNGTVASETTTATVTYGSHSFDTTKVTDCVQKGDSATKLTITETVSDDCTWNNVVTAPTCTDKGYTTHTCSVCNATYVDAEVAALGHAYESSVWSETEVAGTYEFKCATCKVVFATSTTPTVYVDATNGDNEDDGLAPATAVNTIVEAVRRLATTGGKVVLCDSYAVSEDIRLPEYSRQIIFTGLIDKTIVGSFNVTGTPKIYLGGSTKLDDIEFEGSGKIAFVRFSNR